MKDIKEYILESSNNEFTCNIYQVESGKRNDAFYLRKFKNR